MKKMIETILVDLVAVAGIMITEIETEIEIEIETEIETETEIER